MKVLARDLTQIKALAQDLTQLKALARDFSQNGRKLSLQEFWKSTLDKMDKIGNKPAY